MEVDIVSAKTGKCIVSFSNLKPQSTLKDVKKEYKKFSPKLSFERHSFRKEARGRLLRDDETLTSLGFNKKAVLYFKDLGPQIGWTTVFLTEYAGPIFIYMFFYIRPGFIYGKNTKSRAFVVELAAGCWCFHYAKRLLETLFVHRFSHSTMPIRNIFKNCGYYWGFAAYIAYYVNHHLYTSPEYGNKQVYIGLALFIFSEIGNFSIHIALRNLRPSNTTRRLIPYPGLNPFTWLFQFVSCPNYTYEVMAWIGFTIMTQCFPVGLFTLAGFYQMTVWAFSKLANYKREFSDFPRNRAAIIPFIL
ncbi:very-long-chain enoyl-CoA reductase-like [Argonauta hians]